MNATLVNAEGWYPGSWRGLPALQMPSYDDPAELALIHGRLAHAAPIIALEDAARLRELMADIANGKGFLLQGGDCAESFDDPVAQQVAGISGLFDAMAERLRPAVEGRLVEVARIAGQFAKPRSVQDEVRDGRVLPAYRGDIVNDAEFEAGARAPDPARMIRAHMQSVGTAASLAAARGSGPTIFTSHEALLLPYEEPLTRRDPAGRWWATSGHMLWLGDRTRQPDGAHVEYLRGVENVVGVKCGPTICPEELLRLVDRLDPRDRPGKLVLIARLGADRVAELLPPLMQAMRGRNIVWTVDPMHGNTTMVEGRKVRRLPDILAEIDAFIAIARAEGVHAGGVHLEMCALDVTECIGGRGPASIDELDRNWLTACDPRLNRAQAIDLAAHVAALIG
ncbi:MAG: 3-deoxy-7-phosphoheptulonate synthase [Sphingomonas sp.]|nr:3-deoxy-7-phosphoheptulonate synthase [Sphingomonas sp.]